MHKFSWKLDKADKEGKGEKGDKIASLEKGDKCLLLSNRCNLIIMVIIRLLYSIDDFTLFYWWLSITNNEHVRCLFFARGQHRQFCIFSLSQSVFSGIILCLSGITNLHLRLFSTIFWSIILHSVLNTLLLGDKNLFGGGISIFPFVGAEESEGGFLNIDC